MTNLTNRLTVVLSCYYADLLGCGCFPDYPESTFVQCTMCRDIQNDPLNNKLFNKIFDEQSTWTRDNHPKYGMFADNRWYQQTFKKSYWYQFYLKQIQGDLND